MEVRGDACPGDLSLVHTEVETCRRSNSPRDSHRGGRQVTQLDAFLVGELRVVGNMPIRAHEEVPRVVGEQVHEDEARASAMDNQASLVVFAGCRTERAADIRGV